MTEHHHGRYLIRQNPRLIAAVLRVKRDGFNATPQVRCERISHD